MYQRRSINYAMELLAVRELKQYQNGRLINGDPCAVPIEDFIENQYGISIEYHCLRKNMRALGQMVFDGGHVPIYDREQRKYTLIDVEPNTMLIDIRLTENKRYYNRLRFTYAHELAHFIKDKEYFKNNIQSPALILGEYDGDEDDTIERGTNILCSYILVPTGQMKKAYYRLLTSGHRETLLVDIASIFGVATSTMKIRLDEHGLSV